MSVARRPLVTGVLGSVCALALAACQEGAVQTAPGPEGGTLPAANSAPNTAPNPGPNSGAGLAAMMQVAPFTVKYVARRRVTMGYEALQVEWLEDVASDGAGRFAIDPLSVESAHPSADDFLLMKSRHQVFDYRYRDFRVYDHGLFDQNYSMTVSQSLHLHAGRACFEVTVPRPAPYGGGRYEALVDAENGLVLRWEELDDQGYSLGRMEVESIDVDDPDLSGFDLRSGFLSNTELEFQEELSAQAGFQVSKPTLLPTGFELRAAAVVVAAGGDEWVRLFYTDGVGRAWFLHRAPPAGAQASPAPNPSGEVHTYASQAFNIAAGSVAGLDVIAAGDVPVDMLLELIHSSL